MNDNKLINNPYWYIKRLLDIILSLVLIVVTFPLMLITVILLVISLGFPIFNQRRYREGLYHKSFLMFKFRTKLMNSDNLPRTERYTKLSGLIDNLKLNELPQLFNILFGQMSFVGPRPFIPGEKLPDGKISEERYFVRPGLTNLAYVSSKDELTHKQKLLYDVEYYNHFGFKQDLLIFLKTPLCIIRRIKKI